MAIAQSLIIDLDRLLLLIVHLEHKQVLEILAVLLTSRVSICRKKQWPSLFIIIVRSLII